VSRVLSTTLLSHLRRPSNLLLFELPAHIPESSQRPDTSPNEGCGPANDISSLSINSENQNRAQSSHAHRTNTPEEAETTQHSAEDVAGFVAAVESFTVLGAASAVDANDVFDHGVDSWSELGAFGNAGDTARGGDLEVAANIDEEEFHGEGVEHAWDGHGDEAKGRVFADGAAGRGC
jgi:hypothetical protein